MSNILILKEIQYRNGFGQEGIVTSNPKRPPTSGVVSNISMQWRVKGVTRC